MASPLYIGIAIHYCCTAGSDFRNGDLSAPAVKEAVEQFLECGLLEQTLEKPKYRATDGMRAWLDALSAVPFPKKQWVIPEASAPNAPPNLVVFPDGAAETWVAQ